MEKGEINALTNLLKDAGIELSAVKTNKILLDLGILEEKTRHSKADPSKVKTYKVLTEKGLYFGVNKENKNNPDETSPAYYVSTFTELLALIETAAK